MYYWGDNYEDMQDYEQFPLRYSLRVFTEPVAQKKPNPYGLYDMLGQVTEITSGACWKGGVRSMYGEYFSSVGRCERVRQPGVANSSGWRCVKDAAPAKDEKKE